MYKNEILMGGPWLAQWVLILTHLDFSSGHDLMVHDEFKLQFWLCADSAEPAWDSLSPSLSTPPRLTLVLSLCLSLSLSK